MLQFYWQLLNKRRKYFLLWLLLFSHVCWGVQLLSHYSPSKVTKLWFFLLCFNVSTFPLLPLKRGLQVNVVSRRQPYGPVFWYFGILCGILMDILIARFSGVVFLSYSVFLYNCTSCQKTTNLFIVHLPFDDLSIIENVLKVWQCNWYKYKERRGVLCKIVSSFRRPEILPWTRSADYSWWILISVTPRVTIGSKCQ